MPTEKDKVTIYDVATEAGVAISTVSRVLNDSKDVSDHTRAVVQDAIRKLHFRPSRRARSLAQHDVPTLAVAVPSFTSMFFNELLKGIKDMLRDSECDLLLWDLGSVEPYGKLWRSLDRGVVDALLLLDIPLTDSLSMELAGLRVPVVAVGMDTPELDCIFWNEEHGARQAAEYLITLGHRDIGVIEGLATGDKWIARQHGFRSAFEAAGISFDTSRIRTGRTSKHAGFSEEAGYEAATALLADVPGLTAIFANSDVQAIGAWKAILDAGLKVPRDISLIGYDDIKVSRFIELTSVNPYLQRSGREAARRLLRQLAAADKQRLHQEVTSDLVIRKSTTSLNA